jgi:hypothetical protein
MALRRPSPSGNNRTERDEGPTDADISAFGDVTSACPACGTSLYDDVALCYKCGHALTSREEGKPGQPLWIKIIALVLIAVIVLNFIGLF